MLAFSGDPSSTRVPRSSVFAGSLARNVLLETGIAVVRSRLHAARCVLFWSYVHISWQAREIRHLWRVRISFCLAGAGYRALFHSHDGRCENMRKCCFVKLAYSCSVHDDHIVWQVRYFRCLGLIFSSRLSTFC